MTPILKSGYAAAAVAVLAIATPAFAADNFTPTNSVNTNFRSKDIGSGTPLQIPFQIPSDSTGTQLFSLANPGAIGLDFGGSLLTLGQKASAASVPTVLSAEQEALLNALKVANGTPADPAYNGSNTASEIALLKQALAQLPAVGATQAVDTVVKSTATQRSTILPVQESASAVAVGGSGNVVGDVLTFVGGSSTVPVSATQASPGKCTVTAVSSGAVTTCVPLAGSLGSYTSLPTNPVATTSSGSGTGATITVSYAGLAVQIAPANTLRRGIHLQPQGTLAYLRGAGVQATADYNAMQVPSGALYETSPAFVGTGALSMITSGTTPLGVYAAEF